jgi:hypothetical protein
MRGSVWPDKLKLELFRFGVNYSGGYIGDHPHRGKTNRPRAKVQISDEAKQNGPRSVGTLIIEKTEQGNRTMEATGEF